MDQKRFDQLTVAFSRAAHRRTLLAVLSGALVSAGLLAAPEAAGKGQGKGKGKHKAKGQGKASTANAAKRRKQRDQRRKRRNATAAACPLCKRQNAQGRCVVDHRVNGQCCTRAGGQSGTCLNGTCWPGPCSGPICTDQTCPDGCCDAQAQCHINDADACGTGGESCAPCDVAGEVCQGGDCVCESGVICSVSGCCPNATDVCNDDDECCGKTTCTAQGKNCGTISDGCDGQLDCGECKFPNTCGGGNPGTPNRCGCTDSTCPAGANCGTIPNFCGGTVSCGGPCPQPGQPCVNNVCGPCVPACAGKACGDDDGCGSPCPTGTCPSGETCLSGTCRNGQGTCEAGQSRCLTGSEDTCNGSAFCFCDITVDGATVCRRSGTCGDCRRNADCGPNRVCISCPGCGGLLGTSCNELC